MQRKILFKLNAKQKELWSDKLMDAANLLLTGILLTQGFSEKRNFFWVATGIITYAILGFISNRLRR